MKEASLQILSRVGELGERCLEKRKKKETDLQWLKRHKDRMK